MTNADAPLLELTATVPVRPLSPALVAARVALRAALADLAAVPDDTMSQAWTWPGKGENETRYAFFRAYEILEQATAEAEHALGGAPARSRMVRLVAPATAARWELQGLLLSLSPSDWDADPGGGEWTIRETLGHIIESQRGFGVGTAWWVAQEFRLGDTGVPLRPPESVWAALPTAVDEVSGSPADIAASLDATLDVATERLVCLPDAALDHGARWMGASVPVGFRVGRWSSHYREHTVQVEKTQVLLNRPPNEVARLVRLVAAAYGRLEAVVFGLPEAPAPMAIIAGAVAEARGIAASVAGAHPATASESGAR